VWFLNSSAIINISMPSDGPDADSDLVELLDDVSKNLQEKRNDVSKVMKQKRSERYQHFQTSCLSLTKGYLSLIFSNHKEAIFILFSLVVLFGTGLFILANHDAYKGAVIK